MHGKSSVAPVDCMPYARRVAAVARRATWDVSNPRAMPTSVPEALRFRPTTGVRTSFLRLCLHDNGGSIRLTDLTLSCAATAHVPKPKRRGGCRERRSENRAASCNRRDAVVLATA